MPGLRDFLKATGSCNRVVIPTEVGLVIDMLEFTANDGQPAPGPSGELAGTARLSQGGQQSPIPGVNLGLGLPTEIAGDAPAIIRWNENGFKIWVVLSKGDKVYFALKPIETAPGAVLIPAKKVMGADGLTTFVDDSAATKLQIVSRSGNANDVVAPSLLIFGDATKPASLRFTPDTSKEDGIVPFGLEPPTALVKGTSIGLEFGAITFDDSETAAAPDQGGEALKIASDPTKTVAWRGIVCRDLKLCLPVSIPLFGGRPIEMWFAAAFGGGVNAVADTVVPAIPEAAGQPERKGFAVHIECIDPTAKGFGGLLPTLVSATMELPIRPSAFPGGAGPIDFIGGKPVRARLTLSRDPVNNSGEMRVSIAFDAQGPNGLLAVRNEAGATNPGHFFNVAAGLATSLIASGEAGDSTVGKLALAGAAGSAFFKPKSEFILNAVELASSGHGLPIGDEMRFSLDYSVALRVKKIGVDGLSVEMVDDQPMRFRIRKVALVYGAGEVGGFKLDYQHAEMEIENPGAWTLPDIGSLKDLLDVIGGRSGRGSMWVEVDLRFKLKLGPVQVSGLTLRATKGAGDDISVSVSKMTASLSIPGVLTGRGEVALGGENSGFKARLSASIAPLNLTADALVIYEPPMTVLGLGVDLPAPIPLANSGLGLFGISGLFGSNATPKYEENLDPVIQKLLWKPDGIDSFRESDGSAFGFGAVIGTLPDMGTAFSAKASLLITVPDVMVRGAVNARAISPRVTIDTTTQDGPGYSALGMFSIDKDAVAFAVIAKGNFKPLLTVDVPFAGFFNRKVGSDWYVYLGADGAPMEGRGIGPVSVKVLPGILTIGADAYLMMRGNGITDWPHGRAVPNGPWDVVGGFVVAFGFSVHSTFGPRPVAYAELNASLDLLLGTSPLTMAGFGSAGGSLHLGPFSVGVQASVAFRKQEDLEYLWAEVVARIELLFVDIEGRVTISHGDGKATATIDAPKEHPLDRVDKDNVVVGATPALTDDSYRLLEYLSESPAKAPVVWPDIIISIPFAVMPEVALGNASQFPGAATPSLSPPKLVGTEMLLYKWTLTRVSLRDVTEAADKTDPNAGVELQKKFAASWQAPRGGGATLSELVLGSHGSALFAKRMADGGESLDNKPMQSDARFCEILTRPDTGWAVGAKALCATGGTRLPAEFIGNLLTQSQVQARARHYAEGQAPVVAVGTIPILDMDGLAPVPAPYRLTGPMVQAWEARRTVRFDAPFEMKHSFVGHYWPPNLMHDHDVTRYVAQVVELTLDEEIRAGQLLLLVPPEINLQITSPSHVEWRWTAGEASGINSLAGQPMRFALAQMTQPDVFVKKILIRRPVARTGGEVPVSFAIGIVGLHGINRSADAASIALNAATKAKATALEKHATDQYKPEFVWEGQYLRTILEAGKIYRLDVDLSWSGTVFEQQADGSHKAVKTDSGDRPRQFFFRTAPKPQGPASAPAPDKKLLPPWAQTAIFPKVQNAANPAHLAQVEKVRVEQSTAFINLTRTDHFDAELVQRYFGGYTPQQSELFRFTKDPLSAHFTQDHVVALAKAYDFDLELAFRRVDKDGPAYESPSAFKMEYSPLLETSALSEAQGMVWKAMDESPCVQPKPGMSGSVRKELEPRAWYELYVRAMQEKLGQRKEAGRFGGVTFRTSRWADPKEMLKDVLTGTGSQAQPYLRGDLLVEAAKIDALRATTIVGDDRTFETAAAAIGADGWPTADEPRLSWLWTASNPNEEDYRLVGVMVESPEPMVRDKRVELVASVDLDMGQASKANALSLCRSDRASCRFLYLATTAIEVRTTELVQIPGLGLTRMEIHPALVFKATATPEGAFSQSVPLRAQPSFAEAEA